MFGNKTQEQEIREAIAAGRRAYDALCEAERYLRSAGNWGLVDTLGGGLLSGLIKHSKMDDAQRCLERARRELDHFRYELRDVQNSGHVNADLGTIVKFLDLFDDGFLVDVFVQSRISKAKKDVERAKNEVTHAVKKLEAMLR